MISLIWAQTEEGIIGKDNKMPWHYPEELRYFRSVTQGHPVIMGRKTYESIGRLLPKRKNIIITRDLDYKVEGGVIVHSVKEALEHAKSDEIFVIGGKQIYDLFFPVANALYVTYIKENFAGDTKLSYNMEAFNKVNENDHENFVTTKYIRRD